MLLVMICIYGLRFSGKLLGVSTVISTDSAFEFLEIDMKGIVNKSSYAIYKNGTLEFDEEFNVFLKNRQVEIQEFNQGYDNIILTLSLPLLGKKKVVLEKLKKK